ncbi:hypothetical protein LSAT2_027548 [Lamellibrachia satsuma]|nr:hypothetical protein LSAT2_027548 [Lamellibrachia satsuma]
MTAYSHEYKDVGKINECSHLNGGCEHICIPTPRGRRCACWDGFNVVNETKCFISKYTCPLEYNATRGRIQNPGYPGYQNNMHCQIIVHIQKPGQVIFLKVEQFDLEHDNDVLHIESERSSMHRFTTMGDTGLPITTPNFFWQISPPNLKYVVSKTNFNNSMMSSTLSFVTIAIPRRATCYYHDLRHNPVIVKQQVCRLGIPEAVCLQEPLLLLIDPTDRPSQSTFQPSERPSSHCTTKAVTPLPTPMHLDMATLT